MTFCGEAGGVVEAKSVADENSRICKLQGYISRPPQRESVLFTLLGYLVRHLNRLQTFPSSTTCEQPSLCILPVDRDLGAEVLKR
jgi:hypothetical protein